MVIVVEGTKSFSDYELFMVGMAKALSHPMNESRIQVWTLGPHKINSFTAAFCNSSEDYLKQKGFKVSFSKVNLDWVKSNIEYVDFFGYFSLPKEPESKAMTYMQKQEGLQVGWFRY